MRIAIYTRKSVYIENSESIDTQIELCKNYFSKEQDTFEIFIDEGYSGGNTKRPSFLNMMNLIKLGKFDAVAIYKVDRISRNIIDFFNIYEELEKYNVKLISITEGFDPGTPVGKMMMIMLSAFADMERENIRQRVKDNMIALAKKGCFTGGFVPFGCITEKKEGKSYLHIKDVFTIQLIFNKYLELESMYSVQKYLLNNKIKTVTSVSSLRSILRNPVYCKSSDDVSVYLKKRGYDLVGKPNGKGYMTYGKTTGYPTAIVGKHKGCIDPEIFLKVNKKLDKNKDDTSKRKSKTYWLSNVLYCPYCGSRYNIVNSNKNSYYVCSNRINRRSDGLSLDKEKSKCVNGKYVNCSEIESKVSKLISSLENIKQFNEVYANNLDHTSKNEIKILEKNIKTNETSINNLVDKLAIASNEVSNILLNKIELLSKENNELKIKLDTLKIEELNKTTSINKDSIKKNIHIFSNTKDDEKKRILVNTIFKKLIYDPYKDHLEIIP